MGIVSGGGGGGGLPGHWTIGASDQLNSTDDFWFRSPSGARFLSPNDSSKLQVLEGTNDLLDVISAEGNAMVGVGHRDINLTAGDGTNAGSVAVARNSNQGTTPLFKVGSAGQFSAFRFGQIRVTPSGDGDVFPNLQLDGLGGTQPVLLWNLANVQPADASLAASSFTLWLDDTAGATKLMVKAKDSGGTVRAAAIALT